MRLSNISNNASSLVRSRYLLIKRAMDVMLATIFLISLLPIMLCIATLIKLTSSGPVLFWSERRGFKGEVFIMPKFRTMTTCSAIVSREVATEKEICVTRIGKVLRKASLDELPQFWSVLKGDMSLVGPRPLILGDYAADYRVKHPTILSVKPGITGLAQINGRSYIAPSKKIKYDLFYARRVCMLLDLKILFRTIGAVFDFKSVM